MNPLSCSDLPMFVRVQFVLAMVAAGAFPAAGAPRPVGAAGWHDSGFESVGLGALAETGRVEGGWEVQKIGRELLRPRLRVECVGAVAGPKCGKQCVALAIPADTIGFEFVTVGQRVQLATGVEYEASAWVRWPDGPNLAPVGAGPTSTHRSAIVSFWARHRDGTGDFAGRDEWLFDNQWHRLTFRFRATDPKQATLVYVSLLPNQTQAATAVLLDEFVLRELAHEQVEPETRIGNLALDPDFSSQKEGAVSPPWYCASGQAVRGEVVAGDNSTHFRLTMNRATSNFESAQLWQHVALREGARYEISCRIRWDKLSSEAAAPIVNFGIYHDESRTWYGPVDQVLERIGEWRTYRFIHIPPYPGPWKLYVQLNGWGNFGRPVNVSVDDLVCAPTPAPR